MLATHVNDVFGAYGASADVASAQAYPGWYDPPWGRADFAADALDNLLPAIGAEPGAAALLDQQARSYAETGLLTTLDGAERLDALEWSNRIEQARSTYVDQLGLIRGTLASGYVDTAVSEQEASDAAANDRGFFEALEYGTGYALTVAAGEAVGVATERYGLAGPLSGVLGDVVNAGVDWSVAEVFEGPAPIDTSAQTAWDSRSYGAALGMQNALVINNAVYESLPLERIPDELRDGGVRVPMAEMTQEQFDVWRAHASMGSPDWAAMADRLVAAEAEAMERRNPS